MTFNINDLRTELSVRNGIQNPALFNVVITPPATLRVLPAYATVSRELSFLCMAASLPNPEMSVINIFRYGYGLKADMPYNAVFTPQTFRFIADGEAYVHTFFRDWQRSIFNYSVNPTINDNAAYLVNYKDTYATDVRINAFNPNGIMIDSIILTEAFPVNVGDIPIEWEGQNELMIIPVIFSFKDVQYPLTTPIIRIGPQHPFLPIDIGQPTTH
jgi:hypothetical protein